MTGACKRVYGVVSVALFSLFFSAQSYAVKPASVAVIVDRTDRQAQSTVEMLYRQTWHMLDGEFDVRFTTPRMTQVDELYQGDDVDLVIALGNAGMQAIRRRAHYEKPTIVITAEAPATATTDNLIVMGDTAKSNAAGEAFIRQVVLALREKLRAR